MLNNVSPASITNVNIVNICLSLKQTAVVMRGDVSLVSALVGTLGGICAARSDFFPNVPRSKKKIKFGSCWLSVEVMGR